MRQKQVPSRAPGSSAAAKDPPCDVTIKTEPVEEDEMVDETINNLPVATSGEDVVLKTEPVCDEEEHTLSIDERSAAFRPSLTDRYSQPVCATKESAAVCESSEREEAGSGRESSGVKLKKIGSRSYHPAFSTPYFYHRPVLGSAPFGEDWLGTRWSFNSASMTDRFPLPLPRPTPIAYEASQRTETETRDIHSVNQLESSRLPNTDLATPNGLPTFPLFPYLPGYGLGASFSREGALDLTSGFSSASKPPPHEKATQPPRTAGRSTATSEGSEKQDSACAEGLSGTQSEGAGMKKNGGVTGNCVPTFFSPFFYPGPGSTSAVLREGGVETGLDYASPLQPPPSDRSAQPQHPTTAKTTTSSESSEGGINDSREGPPGSLSESSGTEEKEATAANGLPDFHPPVFFPRFSFGSSTMGEGGLERELGHNSGVFMVMQPGLGADASVQFRDPAAGKSSVGTPAVSGPAPVEPPDHKSRDGVAGKVSGRRGRGSGKKPQCLECGKCLANSTLLAKHVETVHRGQKNFICPECGKVFGYKGSMKKHIESAHTAEKQYACVECSKMFGCKEYLVAHMKTVHRGEQKCECTECGKTFSHKSSLDKHIAAVHRGERFSCPECSEQFTRKATLNSHVEMIHRQVKHQCMECGDNFGQRRLLRAHLESVHKGSVRFMCFDCNENFTNKFTLEAHVQKVHRGDRSFQCQECKKCFTQNCHLQTHIRTVHLGVKNFECTQCDKKFSKNWKLKLHVESVHQGIRKYPCPECGKSFSSKAYVDIHVDTIHRGQKNFKCEQCGSSFTQKSSLNMHIETVHNGQKKFECPECGRGFTHSSHMKVHLQAVHKGGFMELTL